MSRLYSVPRATPFLGTSFTPEELQPVLDDLYQLFETRFAKLDSLGLKGEELISHYYGPAKAVWRQCAKRMCHSLPLAALAGQEKVRALLRRIGLKDPMFLSYPEVRTDMPDDEQYMQPWHQDWRSGQGSLNAVTIWVPLRDVSTTDGAIEVIPGSHRWGLLEVEEIPNPRRFSIIDSRVSEPETVTMDLHFGECAVFSQMLVHRSGRNSSGRPRLSLQLHYSDRGERHFIDNGYKQALNSELVWDEPPDAAAMKEIYGSS